jgi:dihydroflavonol-4-reductase
MAALMKYTHAYIECHSLAVSQNFTVESLVLSERTIDLVTGATGHVGFNLVQHLLAQGRTVRAGVRTPAKTKWLAPLGCEIVLTELLDNASLVEAMKGVDVVYSVAGAFKTWAKNPAAEIIRPNIEGARHIVEAAAAAGVRKLVYVSSMTTLDSRVQPFSATTWNPFNINPYEYSKTEGEKLALKLAREKGVDISTILPAAITGPNFREPTESSGLFPMILAGKLTMDPDLHLLLVDARDVAAACHVASTKGRNGERYIVSNEMPVSTGRMVAIAQEMFPELHLKTPGKLPRSALLALATVTSGVAKLLHRPPMMRSDIIRLYGGASHLRIDAANTKRDLALTLIDNEQTVRDSFRYTREWVASQTAIQGGS